MKWLQFQAGDTSAYGVLQDGMIHQHAGALFSPFHDSGLRHDPAQVCWLAPCRPGKIIGLWNNFREAASKNGWAEPSEPLYFLKSPGSACGHQARIPEPPNYSGRVVYEGELAVVIGKTARQVGVQEAAQYIFGYSCANDVTALELLQRDAAFAQWSRAKSFDGFAAFGPVIETDFDVGAARLRTLVGARERQNYALSDMFFSPAELVARISCDMTLEPGDVIFCGTSLGVLPMKSGTTVEVVIDGIGSLSNLYGSASAA